MIADPGGERLLGVQIVAEDAAELIHLGQVTPPSLTPRLLLRYAEIP